MKKIFLLLHILSMLLLQVQAQLYDVNGNYNIKGNVGIGTSNPSGLLEVRGIGEPYKMFRLLTIGGGGLTIGAFDNSMNPVWNIQTNSNEYLQYTISGTNTMFLTAGAVGIGTKDTRGFKLAVKGKIGAEEIQVKANYWPDFVFKDDYQLRNLEEVESFIEENNHLPDIPSEEDVIKNGIQLGKMNAKLLQKIEELMLYTIQQEKKIKKLQEIITRNNLK